MANETSADTPAVTPLERFDFGQAGHISVDQLRILKSIDEQVARNLTHTLSAWLRVNMTVLPLPNEQQPFQLFAEASAADYVLPIQLTEHHVRGALQWNMRLVPEVVDLLLGGSGNVPAMDRELTEIEETVLLSVVELVVRELNAAWQHIGLSFEMQSRDRDGQQNRLMAAQEKTLCMRYEVTMPGVTGELCFCFPVSAVNTSLRAFAAIRDVPRPRSPEERHRMETALRGVRVNAGLCFPPVRIPAIELQQLRPGSLLRLPLSQHAAAELRLSDTVVCAASAVRTSERRAVRVTALPEDQQDHLNGGHHG